MIAFSLGNFASWDNLARGGTLSLSAILRVRRGPTGRVLGGRWIALKLVGPGLPRLDPSGASTALVRTLSRQDFASERFDGTPGGVIEPGAGR